MERTAVVNNSSCLRTARAMPSGLLSKASRTRSRPSRARGEPSGATTLIIRSP